MKERTQVLTAKATQTPASMGTVCTADLHSPANDDPTKCPHGNLWFRCKDPKCIQEMIDAEDAATCPHGFLAGCPTCIAAAALTPSVPAAEPAAAQQTAEPVAWRVRYCSGDRVGPWSYEEKKRCSLNPSLEAEPLYAAPQALSTAAADARGPSEDQIDAIMNLGEDYGVFLVNDATETEEERRSEYEADLRRVLNAAAAPSDPAPLVPLMADVQEHEAFEAFTSIQGTIHGISLDYWRAGRDFARSAFASRGADISWAVQRWESEVRNRPLVNKNRRPLDDVWRQVIRRFGGDPIALIGPAHDDLLIDAGSKP